MARPRIPDICSLVAEFVQFYIFGESITRPNTNSSKFFLLMNSAMKALCVASEKGHVETARVLLESRADVNEGFLGS